MGIAYVRVDTAADADRLADLELIGQIQRFARWSEWTSAEFEVRSAVPVEVGVDGEALTLEPPLRFVIRPRALTVRLPRTAPGRSRAARRSSHRQAHGGCAVANGHRPPDGD